MCTFHRMDNGWLVPPLTNLSSYGMVLQGSLLLHSVDMLVLCTKSGPACFFFCVVTFIFDTATAVGNITYFATAGLLTVGFYLVEAKTPL